MVAISYFGYIRRSMKRVDNNTGSDRERGGLRRTWFFALGTSVVVTLTGVVYAGAALAVAGWTSETLSNPFMLGTITLVTL